MSKFRADATQNANFQSFNTYLLTCLYLNRLKVIGAYGLKNKREVWRVQFTLAKIRYVHNSFRFTSVAYRVYFAVCRKAARDLLTLDEKDQRRVFEGTAIIVI